MNYDHKTKRCNKPKNFSYCTKISIIPMQCNTTKPKEHIQIYPNYL